MSTRLDQVNKNIQRVFGEILQQEADLPTNVLVTISRVDTTPNMRHTHVWLYIQPLSAAKKTMESLTEQLFTLQGSLNRMLDRKRIPRVALRIDYGAEHADKIERRLNQLRQDEDTESS
ncbi:hypothetical protein CL628_01830 [bacterium]|nr:hypothetical protein [bacterium]